jgi:hypothetical protein
LSTKGEDQDGKSQKMSRGLSLGQLNRKIAGLFGASACRQARPRRWGGARPGAGAQKLASVQVGAALGAGDGTSDGAGLGRAGWRRMGDAVSIGGRSGVGEEPKFCDNGHAAMRCRGLPAMLLVLLLVALVAHD